MSRGPRMCWPIVTKKGDMFQVKLFWGELGKQNFLVCAPVKNKEMAIRQVRIYVKKLGLQHREVIYREG